MNTAVNPAEVAKFDALADDWWNPQGPMKPLHQLNPLRLQYIKNHVTLADNTVLDIGCGGGLLSEALAQAGANVTGLDMSQQVLRTAQQHAEQQELNIDYQHGNSHDFAAQHAEKFDIITCMELLEHVPDPQQTCRSMLTAWRLPS